MNNLKVGSFVRLNTPDNPHLDGARATVMELTNYGAKVATGIGSGEFRALGCEMVPYAQVNGTHRAKAQAKDQGYSGEMCEECGSLKMRRAGSCLVCDDCGKTSGCS